MIKWLSYWLIIIDLLNNFEHTVVSYLIPMQHVALPHPDSHENTIESTRESYNNYNNKQCNSWSLMCNILI